MCLISKSWGASGNRVWKHCSRSEFLRPVLEASPEPHTLLGLLGGCKWVGKKSGKFPGTYQKFPTMSQIFRKFPKNLGKFPKIPDFRSLFMILSPWQVYLLYKTLLSYRLSVVLNFCQIALNCSGLHMNLPQTPDFKQTQYHRSRWTPTNDPSDITPHRNALLQPFCR